MTDLDLVGRLEDVLGVSSVDPTIDQDIRDSLNPKFTLRSYQTEAIGRAGWLFSLDPSRFRGPRAFPRHVLFNMATGAGKTLVMAANLLQLAKHGHRRFLYVVNSSDLVAKTKVVLGDAYAGKYLFAPSVTLEGQPYTVNLVDQFPARHDPADRTLYVVATTIHKLHEDVVNPRQDGFHLEDLTKHPLVILADEAHHFNVDTNRRSDDVSDESNWETTIQKLLGPTGQGRSWLLEYTATVPATQAAIDKYEPLTIARYDFRQFRQDGWSKQVELVDASGAASDVDRLLTACVVSEHRRRVAASRPASFNLKPVVMVKHTKTVKSLEFFYGEFHDALDQLEGERLQQLAEGAADDGFLSAAFAPAATSAGADRLADQLRQQFSRGRCWKGHSKEKVTPEQVAQINTLEDADNPIRLVFVVSKLTEGWDVLNLFDIVRVGEAARTSDSRKTYSTSEAQLIGRGARYLPYPRPADAPTHQRVAAAGTTDQLALETLHYHSANDSGYINALKDELSKQGVVDPPSATTPVTVRIKDPSRPAYRSGKVFTNQPRPQRTIKTSLADCGVRRPATARLDLSALSRLNVDDTAEHHGTSETLTVRLQDLGPSVVRTAARRVAGLDFSTVRRFADVSSMQEFLQGSDWLGGLDVEVTVLGRPGCSSQDLLEEPPARRLHVASQAIASVWPLLRRLRDARGSATTTLTGQPVHALFPAEHTIRVARSDDPLGLGHALSRVTDDAVRVDLAACSWYAHDENYGTSEEKLLIRWVRDQLNGGVLGSLAEDDIYLLRNEKQVALYDPDTGQRFEPDFVLLLGNDAQFTCGWQVYIEPKGAHLKEHDRWKQDLLERLGADIVTEDGHWTVRGLPFFNADDRSGFDQRAKDLLADRAAS